MAGAAAAAGLPDGGHGPAGGLGASERPPRLMAAEKLAVVLGTEGDGLSDGTIAACDYTVRIPMTHGVKLPERGRRQRRGLYQLGLMSGGTPT